MLENENTVNTSQVKKPRKISLFKKYFPLIMIVLVIILALTSAYFYKKSKSDPNAASQAEVRSLVNKVGRLMILPEGEIPTIATVSDPEALKDQVFFVDAKKGDKVLIYSIARKAILYNPASDKIVTIAPLNTDTAQNPTVIPEDQPKATKKN